jgi:hypothetical protein
MFIILVLYVDDILLACSDKNLLHVTKGFLSSNFHMKELGDASYVLGIEIIKTEIRVCLDYLKEHILRKCLRDTICINVLVSLPQW